MAEHRTPTPNALLKHASFVKGLAHHLVRDPGAAQDLAQETWLVALEKPPPRSQNLRAWLGGVLRNLVRVQRRSERRRLTRERLAGQRSAVAQPDEIVSRLEWDRRVVDAVLALEEPYRSTIVHRYFDGLRPPEIARSTGVPRATVYTRLRRALELLRAHFDAQEGGDRTAWTAALPAALVPKPAMAVGASATAGAAIMSTKTASLAFAVVIAVSFLAGWTLRADAVPDAGAHTAGREGRPQQDDYEALRGALTAERGRRERLERELLEGRAVPGAPEAAEAATATAGPRFVYGGLEEALRSLDWDVIGESVSASARPLREVVEALLAGESLESVAEAYIELQRHKGPLNAQIVKLLKSGLEHEGMASLVTHPAVAVNVVHAALGKAGLPLSAEQEARLEEIGLRYTEENRARVSAYGEDTLALARMADEAALKERFFAEMFGALTPEQHDRIRPPSLRGYTNVDMLSAAIVYTGPVSPLPFKDRPSLERTVADTALKQLGLPDSARPVVEAAVRTWSQSMGDDYLSVPAPSSSMHEYGRVQAAARNQAALYRELARSLSLSEEQLASLIADRNVLVPYLAKG